MPNDFLTPGVSKGGRDHGRRKRPHSFCQFNEKEMKASVLMTEFHSKGATGKDPGARRAARIGRIQDSASMEDF